MILLSLLLICQAPATKSVEPVKSTENKASVPAAEAPPTAAEIQAAVAAGEGTKAVNAFYDAMKKNDNAGLLRSSSGRLRTMCEVIAEGDGDWGPAARDAFMLKAEIASTDFIRVPMLGNNFFVVRRSKGIWLLCDICDGNGKATELDIEIFKGFQGMLKAWGASLQAEAKRSGEAFYPERLESPVIEGKISCTKCHFPYFYAGALPLNGKEKKVLACLTKPYYGKRAVLWSDGSTEMLDEADFKKLGFVANQYKAPLLDPALAKTVADLVTQLGGSAKERRETRKKLTALGLPAVKILKTHTHNADPEIAETVKEIIDAILPKQEEKKQAPRDYVPGVDKRL